MFTSPFVGSRPSRSAIHAYQHTGVQTQVLEADPHRLVAMLFDGLAEAIAQARGALRQHDAKLKGRAIGRAVAIVDEGLRAPLDLQHGGELARSLHDLYAYMTLRLTRANLCNDDAALEECSRLLAPLREAWTQIRSHVASPAVAA